MHRSAARKLSDRPQNLWKKPSDGHHRQRQKFFRHRLGIAFKLQECVSFKSRGAVSIAARVFAAVWEHPPQEIANYLQPAISESGSGCLCAANLLGIFPSRPTRRGKRLKSKQSSQPDTVRSTKQRWRRCEPEEANWAGRYETLP
jgi:hypothetical protein